jgi:predicted RNA-binding protein with RPS1 domain
MPSKILIVGADNTASLNVKKTNRFVKEISAMLDASDRPIKKPELSLPTSTSTNNQHQKKPPVLSASSVKALEKLQNSLEILRSQKFKDSKKKENLQKPHSKTSPKREKIS